MKKKGNINDQRACVWGEKIKKQKKGNINEQRVCVCKREKRRGKKNNINQQYCEWEEKIKLDMR